MPVTLRDVGKLAGVSAMTVSRVINGRGGRRRRHPAPGRGGDRGARLRAEPHRPRACCRRRPETIGLIVPDVVNPFFAPVVRGAETAARRAGYRVLLCNSEGDLRLEREYIDDMVAHRVEGLLLAPASDRLAPQHLPAAARRLSRSCCSTARCLTSIATSWSATASPAPGAWSST